MKNIAFAFFALLMVGVAGCKKDYDDISKVVTVSFPSIELKGDKYVSLTVGQAYDDPGAVAVDDVASSRTDITAEYSSLDVNTPGLYYMQYYARNANGYETRVGRYIAVTDYSDAVDLSGVYERTTNGVEVNLERVARGLYMTDDMGGAAINDVGYFAVINDSTIDFGPQFSETLGTEIAGFDAFLNMDTTGTAYGYVLDAPGYGTALRTFVKVEE